MLNIPASLVYSGSRRCLFKVFVCLSRLKDEDGCFADASDHLFREIGYTVV
jgi:hypothetical protein